MSTIYEFYKAKDELLKQINKDYEQYLNKKVNIILKGEKHPTPLEYAQVIYEGIYFQNGFLNLKYRCVKNNGTPARSASSFILYPFDQLEFHLINE